MHRCVARLPVRGDNETRMPFHGFRCGRGALVMHILNWVAPSSNKNKVADSPRYWTIGLFIFIAWVLFSNLGVAALIEPDEGRNAEIAREILLLRDWVTPHYDFIARLDKPILFFDLVALSYKVFGISEWSARLPSALTAFGCLSLTYFFSRSLFGRWAAFWSTLILLTSLEFFALSRIVILDMLLTFFLTLALCCFFLGQRGVERGGRKIQFVLMYAAMGAATLVKGPIGVMLPTAVIVFYLVFTKRWMLVRHMEIPLGISIFLLTAAPWYILVEYRNPGYLHHFFWKENVARFATSQFKHSGSWYYFIMVLSAGFLPWTVMLPTTIANLWKRSLDGERLFMILWIALPLLGFSLSSSKLPHYILPIFPPLAIVVGMTVAKVLTNSSAKTSWLLSFPAVFFFLLSIVVILLALWPQFLPYRLQGYVHATFAGTSTWLFIAINVALVLVLVGIRRRLGGRQIFLYAATCIGFAVFILCAEPILATVSLNRSSKQLAEKAVLFIRDKDQLVLYGGYPSSLPFYLNIQRPIWVVWSGKKSKVLGSDYVAKERPEPAANYGKVLYTHEEFAELWKTSKQRFVVFVDSGAVDRFERLIGPRPRILFQHGDTVLVENSGADRESSNDKAP
jgi:4-amino-4-deoxy-L-arabinose transferase-like glycosyltransferase